MQTVSFTECNPHLYVVNAVILGTPQWPPNGIGEADANLGVYPAELSELRESFGESQDGYVTLAEGFIWVDFPLPWLWGKR